MPLTVGEIRPCLYKLDRATRSTPVTAGAAEIDMPRLPQDTLARLETVVVAGDNLGGATVTLYRDEVAIENVLGAVTLGATDTATSFSDGSRPWLYGLEQLLVVVSGAASATRVAATVWQALYFIERPAAQPAAPAPAGGSESEDD